MSTAHYSPPTKAKIVCLACRQQNIKCVPSPHGATQPCSRCARKGLMCQYVSRTVEPSTSAGPGSSRDRSTPSASLPYTGPPPSNSRPRYSDGAQYPDLSLSRSDYNYNSAPNAYAPNSSYGYPASGYPNTAPASGYGYPSSSNANPAANPNNTYSSSSYAYQWPSQ
ncbi:hypothetical protein C8F01DRAFT_1254419 [Mycena amicta]|nr:hypothetical protein C8F01DRAFT_1254419 [Mycena amicta]